MQFSTPKKPGSHLLMHIDHLEVKVSFPCRLFFEYSSTNRQVRTPELTINPKIHQYVYNVSLPLNDFNNPVTVKLLSARGMEFTAGSIYVGSSTNHQKVKIGRSTDIEIYCHYRVESKNGSENLKQIQEEEGVDLSKLDLVENIEDSKEKQGSALTMLPEVSKFHRLAPHRNIITSARSQYKCIMTDRQARSGNKMKRNQYYQDEEQRVGRLERRLQEHLQLYDKQKQLLDRTQNKYKEAINLEEKLRSEIANKEKEIHSKSIRIAQLQQERLYMLNKEVKEKKDMLTLKNVMKQTLQALEEELMSSLNEKEPEKDPQNKVELEASSSYKMTSSFVFNQNLSQSQPPEFIRVVSSRSFHDKQMSLDYSKMAEEAQASLGKKSNKSLHPQYMAQLFKSFKPIQEETISAQIKECIDLLTKQCVKITSKVIDLIRSAVQTKNRKNPLSQEKLNKEQIIKQNGLSTYIQRLEESHEKQLQLNYEKEQTILDHLIAIEDLNQQISLLQSKLESRNVCRSTQADDQEERILI